MKLGRPGGYVSDPGNPVERLAPLKADHLERQYPSHVIRQPPPGLRLGNHLLHELVYGAELFDVVVRVADLEDVEFDTLELAKTVYAVDSMLGSCRCG